MTEEVKPAETPATETKEATPAVASAVSETTVAETKPATLATTDAPEVKQAAPADWPADWRDKFAESMKPGDAAFRKRMDRFASPLDIGKSWLAIETKQSSGELKSNVAFPKDGDEKAQAEWRKQNGIPETKDGYEPKVEGLVFGEADKPMLDSFKDHAFGKNWTPGQFNEALAWYANEQQQIKARQDEADAKFRETTRDQLYSEWGPQDFRANVNAVKNLFSQAPEGFAERIFGARLADGKLAGDDPAFLRYFAQLSRELNPAATLVPPGSDIGRSISTRKMELEAMIADRTQDKGGYYRGPNADKLQAEYRNILDTESKLKSRAA